MRKGMMTALAVLATGIVFGFTPQAHTNRVVRDGVTYVQRGALGAGDYVVTNVDAQTVGRVQSVNGKTGTVVLGAADVGALADTTTHLSGDVPTSRTVNGKPLTSNVTLGAADVSALPDSKAQLVANTNFKEAVEEVSPPVVLPTHYALSSITNADGTTITGDGEMQVPAGYLQISKDGSWMRNVYFDFDEDPRISLSYGTNNASRGYMWLFPNGITLWKNGGGGLYNRTILFTNLIQQADVVSSDYTGSSLQVRPINILAVNQRLQTLDYPTKSYLTQNYLTQANATSTYLSKTDANTTYLKKTDAQTTYETPAGAQAKATAARTGAVSDVQGIINNLEPNWTYSPDGCYQTREDGWRRCKYMNNRVWSDFTNATTGAYMYHYNSLRWRLRVPRITTHEFEVTWDDTNNRYVCAELGMYYKPDYIYQPIVDFNEDNIGVLKYTGTTYWTPATYDSYTKEDVRYKNGELKTRTGTVVPLPDTSTLVSKSGDSTTNAVYNFVYNTTGQKYTVNEDGIELKNEAFGIRTRFTTDGINYTEDGGVTGSAISYPLNRSGTIALTTVGSFNDMVMDASTNVARSAECSLVKTNLVGLVGGEITNTVNAVKGQYYDAPLAVNWTIGISNGDMTFSATTNVNQSVLN